jgi:hypothetical protein
MAGITEEEIVSIEANRLFNDRTSLIAKRKIKNQPSWIKRLENHTEKHLLNDEVADYISKENLIRFFKNIKDKSATSNFINTLSIRFRIKPHHARYLLNKIIRKHFNQDLSSIYFGPVTIVSFKYKIVIPSPVPSLEFRERYGNGPFDESALHFSVKDYANSNDIKDFMKEYNNVIQYLRDDDITDRPPRINKEAFKKVRELYLTKSAYEISEIADIDLRSVNNYIAIIKEINKFNSNVQLHENDNKYIKQLNDYYTEKLNSIES